MTEGGDRQGDSAGTTSRDVMGLISRAAGELASMDDESTFMLAVADLLVANLVLDFAAILIPNQSGGLDILASATTSERDLDAPGRSTIDLDPWTLLSNVDVEGTLHVQRATPSPRERVALDTLHNGVTSFPKLDATHTVLLSHFGERTTSGAGMIVAVIGASSASDLDTCAEAIETVGHLVASARTRSRISQNADLQVKILEAQRNQLSSLFEASANVKREAQIDTVLAVMVHSLTEVGGFGRAAVYLLEKGGSTLSLHATEGIEAAEVARMRNHPIELATFAPLMRPEMLVSRSYLFDHLKYALPTATLSTLSVPVRDSRSAPGIWHPLDSLTIPLLGASGEFLGLISVDEPNEGIIPDEAHVRALEYFADQCATAVASILQFRELETAAETDGLTRLPNRVAFKKALISTLGDALSARYPVAVLFLDIDHFKQVNDTYGHLVGDDVIRNLARGLRSSVRQADLLARFGGEEFVLMLPNTKLRPAEALAEKIRNDLEHTPVAASQGQFISVTVSIGVSSFEPSMHPSTITAPQLAERLLETADQALYRAKASGRNNVWTYAG